MDELTTPDPSLQYVAAIETLLGFLFDEFERLSLWNSAYRHAIQNSGDPIALRSEARQFAARDQYPLGMPKYSGLRRQAVESVQAQNLAGLVEVIVLLRERFFVWDGTQEKTR